MIDEKLIEILDKLVVAHLPFPLSVPKEFALKCAERAKEEVKEAQSKIKSLVIESLGEEMKCKFINTKCPGIEKIITELKKKWK